MIGLYVILAVCALAMTSRDPAVVTVGVLCFVPAFVGVWIRTRR